MIEMCSSNFSTFSNCSRVNNGTESERIWESVVPPALLLAFGVTGNTLAVIILKVTAREHKWRPFYRLVGGLALTDGIGIILVYPIAMVTYATDFTFKYPKPLCGYSSFVFTFMLIASAGIVCAMSFDRFLALTFPFVYNRKGKRKRANISLLIIWTGSTILCSLHLFGLGSVLNVYPYSWCFSNFVSTALCDRINAYIYSIAGLIVLCTTVGLNATVIFILLRQLICGKEMSNARKHSKFNHIYNLVFLLAIVILFSSCFAPLITLIFQHAALVVTGDGPTELYRLRQAVLNSAIDPWIYIILRKDMVIQVIRLLGRCKRRNASIQDTSQSNIRIGTE